MDPLGFMRGIFDPEWTSFTPSWRASGRTPELRNGTLHARSRDVDGLLEVELRLVIGSATDPGSGTWLFSTPAPIAAVRLGIAQAVAASVAGVWQFGVSVRAGMLVAGSHADPARVGSMVPMAWSAGDELRLVVRCEVAAKPAPGGNREGQFGVPDTCLRCGSLVADGFRATHDDWHLRAEGAA